MKKRSVILGAGILIILGISSLAVRIFEFDAAGLSAVPGLIAIWIGVVVFEPYIRRTFTGKDEA